MHRAEQFGLLPGDHILGLVEAIAARFALPEYRGCAFLNAIVESGSEPTAARPCVTTHKDGMRDWVEAKLVQVGAKAPPALAEQMMLLVDGAFMRALMYPDSAIDRHAQEAAVTLLQTAGIAITGQE